MPCDLRYRVTPAEPHAHLFEILIEIDGLSVPRLVLAMPAWIPGSYMIRDFARNVVMFEVTDASGTPLAVVKRDKQTWTCPVTPGRMHVRYRVHAWELGVRSAHLDATHAAFNGANLLMRVQGCEDVPCVLDLPAPSEPDTTAWRVATSLLPVTIDARGFGSYLAENYADLIDHPVEIGVFDEGSFRVAGVPHRIALSGRHHGEMKRLEEDLARICAEHVALFGTLPLDRYLFLITAVGEGYGGLEHRYSTSLLCAREDLPHRADQGRDDGYIRLLGLCSHEYFHLWNVKRIRPEALLRADLSQEAHTRTLWAFEGITSYYDDLALVRSGRIEVKTYLGLCAAAITRFLRTPGRQLQTLAESSFDTWTKFYKQDENAPNAIVSYYLKGAIVALVLDLTIRAGTRDIRSLDDVMRELWQRHGCTGLGVGERAIEAIAGEATGLDLEAFFNTALDETEDFELAQPLRHVGIAMRLRPGQGARDLGGFVERFEPAQSRLTLDIRLRPSMNDAILQHVIKGGAGEHAGLAPGDQVVAVDGLRANSENVERLIERAAGASGGASGVLLHLFRRDELLQIRVAPLPARPDTCELAFMESLPEWEADPQIERWIEARAKWLASLV